VEHKVWFFFGVGVIIQLGTVKYYVSLATPLNETSLCLKYWSELTLTIMITWDKLLKIHHYHTSHSGPSSIVSIATGLDGVGIESQWGVTFSAPVQTGPGAHPASCTKGTGSFPGVESSRGVMLTPYPLLVLWS
jgi:hypothetical protein